MNDLTKPEFCNQGQCGNKTEIAQVLVRSCSGLRLVPLGSVVDVGRGGKLTNRLKPGVQLVAWHTWCQECWDKYQEQRQVNNLQSGMEV